METALCFSIFNFSRARLSCCSLAKIMPDLRAWCVGRKRGKPSSFLKGEVYYRSHEWTFKKTSNGLLFVQHQVVAQNPSLSGSSTFYLQLVPSINLVSKCSGIRNVYSPIIQKPLIVRIILNEINVLRGRVAQATGRAGMVAVAVRVWAECHYTTTTYAHLAHRLTWNKKHGTWDVFKVTRRLYILCTISKFRAACSVR